MAKLLEDCLAVSPIQYLLIAFPLEAWDECLGPCYIFLCSRAPPVDFFKLFLFLHNHFIGDCICAPYCPSHSYLCFIRQSWKLLHYIVHPTMHVTATFAVASALFAATLAAPAPEAEAAPFCHPGWPQTTYVACNTISTSTKVTTSTRWEAATETSTLIITKVSTVTEQKSCPTGEPSPPLSCINEEDADKMADVFRLLIQEYS